jgi:membrane-associated phospholipid phosphatase
MSTIWNWMVVIIVSVIAILLVARQSHAGRSMGSLGDASMMIVNGWALGLALNETGWGGTMQYFGSMVGAQLTTEIIKTKIIHERRPNGLNTESFPSGHATGAFSGATFIHKRYGWKKAVVPYALASLTAYSRVHTRMHYVHDVVAGAIIAGLFTWAIVDDYNTQVSLSTDTTGAQVNFKIAF